MKTHSKKVFILSLAIFLSALFLTGCQSKGDNSVAYERGILTETGFESEFLNLRFTAPEGYILATEEEMMEMADFGGEIAYKDTNKLVVDYSKANTVYEMMVSAPAGYPNISILVEKVFLSGITVDKYLDVLEEQLSDVTEYNYVISSKRETVEIAGQTYTQLSTKIRVFGFNVIQNYVVRKSGNRIVGFIVTYTDDTEADTKMLLDAFTAY